MICPHCKAEINPAAELARQRANKLTPERRKEIAHKAIKARWDHYKVSKSNKDGPG